MAAPRFLTNARSSNISSTLNRVNRGGKRQITSRTGVTIEVQGVNTMVQHLETARMIVNQITPQIVAVSTALGVSYAREIVPWRTGATSWSIHADPVKNFGGSYWAEYGPTTPYARFLEWGTINMTPRPFMIPSADQVASPFIMAMMELAKVVDKHSGSSLSRGGPSGQILNDPVVQSHFTGLRSFLYSTSKYLGDIVVLGGAGLINPMRSDMLRLSRALGDVNATMKGAVGMRIQTRLSGRASARIIGFGRASIFGGGTYSASFATSGGSRAYQRIAGSVSGSALTSFNFPD